jgi:hypothetical protein
MKPLPEFEVSAAPAGFAQVTSDDFLIFQLPIIGDRRDRVSFA